MRRDFPQQRFRLARPKPFSGLQELALRLAVQSKGIAEDAAQEALRRLAERFPSGPVTVRIERPPAPDRQPARTASRAAATAQRAQRQAPQRPSACAPDLDS